MSVNIEKKHLKFQKESAVIIFYNYFHDCIYFYLMASTLSFRSFFWPAQYIVCLSLQWHMEFLFMGKIE